MFGFLNPRPHSRDYRRAYARLCQHQRRAYGVWSLPFHSYEAVFLYQCALDAGAFSAATMPDVRCCRLAAPASLPHDADAAIGRFCASVALLLGSIKLDDDIRDTRGLPARLARWILQRRIALARQYFARLDPRFERNVEQLIADHHRLETRGGFIRLDEYAEPTALSFGYIFGLAANLHGLSSRKEVLAALGRHLGEAIIAFDCAVDWKRDRRRGEFNPLPDEVAVADAMNRAMNRLGEAEALARQEFGGHSRAAATLAAVQSRVRRMNPLADALACPTHSGSTFARARRAARFVLLPVLSGGGGQPNEETYSAAPPDGVPPNIDGQPPHLPGGIETSGNQKGGRRNNGCCDGCCECAYCGALGTDCCQCGVVGGDCCAGAECCACAA